MDEGLPIVPCGNRICKALTPYICSTMTNPKTGRTYAWLIALTALSCALMTFSAFRLHGHMHESMANALVAGAAINGLICLWMILSDLFE